MLENKLLDTIFIAEKYPLKWTQICSSKGYILENTNNTYYGRLGKSILDKDLIITSDTELYIFNSEGKLKLQIDLLKLITKPYTKIHFSFGKELKPNVYGVLCTSDNNEVAGYLIFRCYINGVIELLNKYQLINSNYNIDEHIFKYIKPEHFYFYATKSNGKYLEALVQEQHKGEVIWEWTSADFPDLFNYITLSMFNNSDPYHINGIEELDNNYLAFSLRHFGIIIVNKKTKKVEKIYSRYIKDTTIKDFSTGQHWIEKISKNEIVIFDNNWDYSKVPTREILTTGMFNTEYDIRKNENKCRLLTYNLENNSSYIFETPRYATPRRGSFMYLKNGIYDINYGTIPVLGEDKHVYASSAIDEIDTINNKLLFSIQFPYSINSIERGL